MRILNMLDEAFAILKQYDWGSDMTRLAPIEDAVAVSHDQADVRQDLENRLIATLQSDISRDAKDYVCRKLAIVGTVAAVPALQSLLGEKDYSHMARIALERMPAPEAAQALRDAAAKVSNELKVGVISSLGSRRDAAAVSVFDVLLKDGDHSVARAAALALGAIGSVDAASVLKVAATSAAGNKPAVIDALLACAEALLAGQKQTDALVIYRSLAADDQARLVRLAATRGILACTSKQS
jgi:HEAT repeat protein